MEDSRKGRKNGEKGQETPSPHVDGKKGKEPIVYKMKEGERKGDWKNIPKKNSGACSRILFVLIRFHSSLFNVVTQYLGPRSRLAFYPTLYKFIVRTLWAWIHSCFGVQAKSGPYNWRRLWETCLI